jgi:hypothetical protein
MMEAHQTPQGMPNPSRRRRSFWDESSGVVTGLAECTGEILIVSGIRWHLKGSETGGC